MKAQSRHPLGGFLLLLQKCVGDEVYHLERVVVLGTLEGGSAEKSLCGDVLRTLTVLPRLLLVGDGVAALEPALKSADHMLPSLVEDEVGVAPLSRDGRGDAIEQKVEADPVVALHVGCSSICFSHR